MAAGKDRPTSDVALGGIGVFPVPRPHFSLSLSPTSLGSLSSLSFVLKPSIESGRLSMVNEGWNFVNCPEY